ncbi:sigma-70 family RNA polymerase sigma factor [Rhodobacteraceae bacterium S2214]|nr:sigma-70 family RNA polymerase sigma factor [Rhodobacteraceae bacterium S2214]
MLPPHSLRQAIDRCAREEWGRILAALTKSLGDMQLAEDCLQDAVTKAIEVWARDGLPRAPAAWLITTARRRAIDRLRRTARFQAKVPELSYLADLENTPDESDDSVIPDKRLEMIFTCCHPALEEKTQVALTLRTLGGLTTGEIARAFLDQPDAMAQRLVRAKRKIAAAGIPYEIPSADMLPARTAAVMSVLYLIFNAGYTGANAGKWGLSDEAIRLARIIHTLMPDDTEVAGLLALMLLHDARRIARKSDAGEMIPLEKQNRNRWDRAKISEGDAILQATLPKGRVGPYQLQAAISALHAQSAAWDDTDWSQIAALYALLYRIQPSPVVRINQAMAVSYATSIDAALEMLSSVAEDPDMHRYQPFLTARADLLHRSGHPDALPAYDAAIALTEQAAERAFLQAKRDGIL